MCCALTAPIAWSQATNNTASPGILGYVDPQTGAFRPVHQTVQSNIEASAVPIFTGTIELTITITVKTAGLTYISCTVTTSVFDSLTGTHNESSTVLATGTGTTRTCKPKIPYAWSLLEGTSDFMNTNFSVFAGAGQTGLPQRTAGDNFFDENRNVPPNGTITSLTTAVTL
jgi:hypothetical protein